MSEYSVYTATVRQMNGVIAERDALAAALAAKTEQVAGLLDERKVLRARIAELEEAINEQQ
jgi:cell division protein FtsB